MTYRRLRRLRPVVQGAVLAAFVALLVATRRDAVPPVPANLFFRLDPLAALAAMIAARAWLAPLTLSALTVALALVAGRAWCGWLCPLGTVLDVFAPRGGRARRPAATEEDDGGQAAWAGERLAADSRWRRTKHVVLVALLGAALAESLALMPLDPLTLLARSLAAGLLPLLNAGLLALEKLLYGVPFLQAPVDWLEANVRSAWLPAEPHAYWPAAAVLALGVAVIALNTIAPRLWCRALCPLGALLGLVSKAALVRRTVSDGCTGCRRCTRTCPMGTIDAARGFESDPAECTVCLDCVVDCPAGAARFALHSLHSLRSRPVPGGPRPYDPARRGVLAALAAGVGGGLLAHVVPRGWQAADALIRPPGAQGGEFWARCIRCGECIKICPTAGLQPAWWQGGVDGFMTPVLVPRTGYCDYSCHSCGQVCPTGAIPSLSLDDKRLAVIGVAAVDRDRCLPWSAATPCIVCEEMCPLPDKAVTLEEAQAVDDAGRVVTVRRPSVIAERCIGCGICEYKCPLAGPAAIRVTRPA